MILLLLKRCRVRGRSSILAYGGMPAKLMTLLSSLKMVSLVRVLVLIYKKKKGFAEARIIKVLKQSPLATEASVIIIGYVANCKLCLTKNN